MNKKGIITLAVSVSLIAAIGIGSTFAYFTDKAEKKNTITFGHVDIDLDEPNFDTEDGTPDNEIKNVTPGQEIVKDPTVTLKEGSEDAYIRCTVNINDLTDAQVKELLSTDAAGNYKFITFKDGWKLGKDGYYYYNKILKAGESVVLFDKVIIPTTWGNEVADMTFSIDVAAEAVQAEAFEPTMDGEYVVSWGEDFVAEEYIAK